MSRSLRFRLVSVFVLVACSSNKPEPQIEPEPTAPLDTAPPVAEPDPVPTATASADAPPVAPTSDKPQPSGRPPVSYSNAEKITETFGATPAAKLELGKEGTILRIPEFALSDGVLLTFMVDKKGKKAKGGAGTIFHLFAQMPPSEAFKPVSTKGPKFELTLNNAKVANPNLAIGEIKQDDKGKEVIEWKVIAPAKKDDKSATFELTDFTNAYLQITSEAPTS
jgi:hypothetical protein